MVSQEHRLRDKTEVGRSKKSRVHYDEEVKARADGKQGLESCL